MSVYGSLGKIIGNVCFKQTISLQLVTSHKRVSKRWSGFIGTYCEFIYIWFVTIPTNYKRPRAITSVWHS